MHGLFSIFALFLLLHLTFSTNPADAQSPPTVDSPVVRGDPKLDRIPLRASDIKIPSADGSNSFDLSVNETLAEAYQGYLNGDPDAALKAIDTLLEEPESRELEWHYRSFRIDVLLSLGRAADAEKAALALQALEQEVLGHQLHVQSLLGRTRTELFDLKAARLSLKQNAAAFGNWQMPTSFFGPPGDMLGLVAKTSAQVRTYTMLAITEALAGRYAKMRQWAEAAETLYNDIWSVADHTFYSLVFTKPFEAPLGRAYNLTALGLARAIEGGSLDAGEAVWSEAEGFFQSIGMAHGEVVVQAMRTFAALELNLSEKGVALAEKGEQLAARKGLGNLVWQFALRKGEFLRNLGRHTEAEKSYRSAQNAIDFQTTRLAGDDVRLRFGAGKERISERLIAYDLQRGDLTALFRDLELGRARAFVSLLSTTHVSRNRQARRIGEIENLERDINAQRLRNGAPKAPKNGSAIARTLLKKRNNAVQALRAVDPELADVMSVGAATLKMVQARLKAGERLIYFLPERKGRKIQILDIGNTSATIKSLSGTGPNLRKSLNAFTDALEAGSARKQHAATIVLARIIGLKQWSKARSLFVVPSGDAHFIPWGALPIRTPVVVLPTGGWLLRQPTRISGALGAVVLGDPIFGAAFPQLPGAREEARIVSALYKANPLIGAAATEPNLRQATSAAGSVLHLATHAVFDPEHPLQSALILTNGNRTQRMTAQRIFEHPLAAKLVILSACETGMGRTIAGDDLLGLSRSFYLSGALAVVSSLWPVDDAGTKYFMTVFHKYAMGGHYGAAWLAARNATRKKGYPPSVYGAFILGGALRG